MNTAILEQIGALCGGDRDAVELIHGAWVACSVWDSLVDKDREITEEQVNKCFLWTLFDLQQNRIYRANPHLALVLRLTVSNWMAANSLQRAPEREKKITAYTLRCSPYDFFVAVVMCVSGPAAADEAALFFRSLDSSDTLEGFLEEHSKD